MQGIGSRLHPVNPYVPAYTSQPKSFILGQEYPVLRPRKILTSQLPVSRWHEQFGDPTLADGHVTISRRTCESRSRNPQNLGAPRQVRCGRRLENRLPLTRRSI